jgi:hypothetical protein
MFLAEAAATHSTLVKNFSLSRLAIFVFLNFDFLRERAG